MEPLAEPLAPVRRFVVLYHTGVPEPHFDWMWETDDAGPLTTLRCPRWPLAPGDVLEELAVHRRAYLDYEGPVSQNRGHVRRVEAGHCTTHDLSIDPYAIAIDLPGRQVVLTHDAASRMRIVTHTHP